MTFIVRRYRISLARRTYYHHYSTGYLTFLSIKGASSPSLTPIPSHVPRPFAPAVILVNTHKICLRGHHCLYTIRIFDTYTCIEVRWSVIIYLCTSFSLVELFNISSDAKDKCTFLSKSHDDDGKIRTGDRHATPTFPWLGKAGSPPFRDC